MTQVDPIYIHPRWRHLVRASKLRELRDLGATVEVNEDGLMRATWPVGGGDSFQTQVTVKLQLLPVREFGEGWASGPSAVTMKDRRFIFTRQLKRVAE